MAHFLIDRCIIWCIIILYIRHILHIILIIHVMFGEQWRYFMDFSEANKIKNVYNNKYEVCTFILVSCIVVFYFVFVIDFFRAFIYFRSFIRAIIDMGIVAVKGIIGIVLFPLSLFNPESALNFHDNMPIPFQMSSQAAQPVLHNIISIQISYFLYFIFGCLEITAIISYILKKIYLELSKA